MKEMYVLKISNHRLTKRPMRRRVVFESCQNQLIEIEKGQRVSYGLAVSVHV
jgi:hypothetical protein